RVSTKTWPSAPEQSTGPEWVYDVFTPPEIYYDNVTKQFTVSAPFTPPPQEPPFGVELIEIRPDVFPLQLVGYIGDEGDQRGTFENALTGETIIGRTGKKMPE